MSESKFWVCNLDDLYDFNKLLLFNIASLLIICQFCLKLLVECHMDQSLQWCQNRKLHLPAPFLLLYFAKTEK